MKILIALLLACSTAGAMVIETNGDMTYCIASTLFNSIRVYSIRDEVGPQGTIEDLQDNISYGGRELVFAMNAGMFQDDLIPMGLLVSEGRQLHPLNTKHGSTNFYAQPNGVFYLKSMRVGILSTSEYQRANINPSLATQSGPILVRHGEILTSRTVSPTSTSTYVRNAVCVFGPTKVAFVITNRPVTMYQFAKMMRDDLHCVDALYMDGAISMMYSPYFKGIDNPHHAVGPVIAITIG